MRFTSIITKEKGRPPVHLPRARRGPSRAALMPAASEHAATTSTGSSRTMLLCLRERCGDLGGFAPCRRVLQIDVAAHAPGTRAASAGCRASPAACSCASSTSARPSGRSPSLTWNAVQAMQACPAACTARRRRHRTAPPRRRPSHRTVAPAGFRLSNETVWTSVLKLRRICTEDSI